YTESVAVWIDYNQNGAFETSEYTNVGTKAGAAASVSGNINVPATALPGPTRMRVRIRFSTPLTGTDACTGYTYGETEDYTVNITPCIPVTVVTPPANTSTSCGSTASFSVTTAGSLPSYSWQYRVNATAAWQTVPNNTPYAGANTPTLTIATSPAAFDGYQYRALVTGACSAVDFSTPPATLTVTPVIPVVDPASASICKGSVQSLTLLNVTNDAAIIDEGFDAVVPLPSGWFTKNNSTPVGTTGWFQGNPGAFPSHSGVANSYIAANYQNVSLSGTISNWLLTPEIFIRNGDSLIFYTRKVGPDLFPDKLEVRLSPNGASTDVGATGISVGDFTNLLLSVNPTLITGVYPTVWTRYSIVVSGLAAPVTGRMAFRYFVTDAGLFGNNSDYIGIDDVKYISKGGPVSGVWTGPAGTMFTDATATTAYTGTPANTIWVKPDVTSDYGVSFSTIVPTACNSEITIVPVSVSEPVSNVVNPENKAVCVGGTTTFTTSADGGPFVYQWQVSTDGGVTYTNIAGAIDAILSLNAVTQIMNGNQYRCVLDVPACASSATTAAAILTVNALPVITLAASDPMLTPGQTTTIVATSTPAAATANSWTWTYNGSALSGVTTNTVSGIDIDKIGTYAATVTDINGCSKTSADIVIGAEVSDRLWIYPNPTTGVFQVRLYHDPNGYYSKRAVYIYNSNGQLMTSREFDIDSRTTPYLRMDFDLGKAAPGTYVVKVVHKYSGKVVSGLIVVH
ncbi:MAG: choice-of-anchor J domain-containing protein, partial [Chitinophagaceae bacterium]